MNSKVICEKRIKFNGSIGDGAMWRRETIKENEKTLIYTKEHCDREFNKCWELEHTTWEELGNGSFTNKMFAHLSNSS